MADEAVHAPVDRRGRSAFASRLAGSRLAAGRTHVHSTRIRRMVAIVNPMGDEPRPVRSPVFGTTHWSVVQAACDSEASQAPTAMETLCLTYWYPLYAFIRRTGRSAHDAEDLTQAFFTRLLEKDYLAAVDRTKGTFRSFLLIALKRFLADEQDRAQAQKRGGGRSIISLDAIQAEEQYQLEPSHNLTPERLFERRWALTVLDRARARLQAEYAAAGKSDLFERLKGFHHPDESTVAYADIAAQLDLPQNTVKSHVHRLRKRYRQLVRDEIAQTVSDPSAVEAEIRDLLDAVADG